MGYLRGLLLIVCALTLSGALLQAESVNRGSAVFSLDRFSGRVSMGRTRGKDLNVHYQVLSLAPGITAAAPSRTRNTNIVELPLRARGGLVVYELRAGKVTTVINGQRQERREGEFWVMSPGKSIVLETDDDSVVIQTIQIINP